MLKQCKKGYYKFKGNINKNGLYKHLAQQETRTIADTIYILNHMFLFGVQAASCDNLISSLFGTFFLLTEINSQHIAVVFGYYFIANCKLSRASLVG